MLLCHISVSVPEFVTDLALSHIFQHLVKVQKERLCLSHALIVCITFRVELYVLFRFMHLLFLQVLTCLGQGQHLGLKKTDLSGSWFYLKLVKSNGIHMCFVFFFPPPKKVSRGMENSAANNLVLLSCLVRARLASPLPLIGFDGTVSTEWGSVFSVGEFGEKDVYCRL